MKPNLVLSLILGIFLQSCASTNYEELARRQEIINKHLSQEKKYLDGKFDERFEMNPLSDSFYMTIGKAIYPIEYKESYIRAAAIADGKFSLINSAPTEMYKYVLQTKSSEAYTFFEKNELTTVVYGLTGIHVYDEDISCHLVVVPTIEGYETNRECRAIVRISKDNLYKAFDLTLQRLIKKTSP